jgi:hypothetical protein
LTSDSKLTAASATCTRNQAVLFVRGRRTPIIFDTGATTNVSNDPSDFINWEREGDCGAIDGLTGQTRIKGIGTVQWTFRTESNKIYKFKTKALFVPDCNIKLLSPQAVFREQGSGSFSINQEGAVFVFPNSSERLFFKLDTAKHRLPTAFLSGEEDVEEEWAFQASVISPKNQNLTRAQVELLKYHFRFGHFHLGWIQRLMRPRNQDEPPIINARQVGSSSCKLPLCSACQLGKQTKRPTGAAIRRNNPERQGVLKNQDLKPGDCISVDHFECTTRGRLMHTFGKEKDIDKFTGGAVYVDHASGLVFPRMQVALTAGDTLRGKNAFERFSAQMNVKIKNLSWRQWNLSLCSLERRL